VHSIEPHHSAYVAMILSKLEGIEVFDRASRGSRSKPTRDSRMGHLRVVYRLSASLILPMFIIFY